MRNNLFTLECSQNVRNLMKVLSKYLFLNVSNAGKISKISLVQRCSAKHVRQVVDLLTLRITYVFLMKALLWEKVSLICRRVGGGLLEKVLLGSELVLLGLLTEAGRL